MIFYNNVNSNKYINCLEYSIYKHDIPLIGFLIKSNANINAMNKSGSNIIFTCIYASNPLILKYFLNLGVNPNLKNNDYNTPLIISLSISKGFDCAKVLLEDTILDILESNKIYSLVDLLIRKIDEGNKKYLELLDLLLKRKKN